MTKPATVADIMVTKVIACNEQDNLAYARKLMGDHGIRHIPVLNEEGSFVGLLTQREVLKQAFDIANRFGMDELERQEKKRLVAEFMDETVETIKRSMPLYDVGEFFLQCKHGCLPVVEDSKIVGIITSSDFVKLSLRLLSN